MKKIIALVLALTFFLVALVACGRRREEETDDILDGGDGSDIIDSITDDLNGESGDPQDSGSNNGDNMPEMTSADVIRGALEEFSKNLAPVFEVEQSEILGFFAGGYYSDDETTLTMGDVGSVPVSEVETLMTYGLITEETLSKVSDAALFFHGMNSNTFSAAAFKTASGKDVAVVADELRVGILNNQWVCGTPEHYSLITVGDCVVSLYGSSDIVNAMENAIIATYKDANVVYSEAL